MKKINFRKYLLLSLIVLLFPLSSNAFFCPTNFNQIDFGMTPDQVTQACGAPTDKKESVKTNDENVPQEWNYYVKQTVSMGGSLANAQGTLRTSMVFDDKGKLINMSVNGIGVGASSICGRNLQLGDDKQTVQSACGKPSFINKQVPQPGEPGSEKIKVIEFIYSHATPPATLVFENGTLKDKK